MFIKYIQFYDEFKYNHFISQNRKKEIKLPKVAVYCNKNRHNL